MEEDAESPSRTNSFDINEVVTGNMPILTKKRKFQSELLSLPVAKHKCYNQASSIPTSADEGKNTELDSCGSTGWSNLESARDSNSSMTEDAESDLSNFYDMPAYKPGHARMYTSGTPTSSFSQGWSSSDNQMCSSDGNVEELARGVIEEDSFLHQEGPINIRKILDEQLLNIHNHVDYTSPEYENDLMVQCGDNETEDHIYTNGGLKSHVLSSERWNIEQESQATTRKPTIDQEFEQYFSMLML